MKTIWRYRCVAALMAILIAPLHSSAICQDLSANEKISDFLLQTLGITVTTITDTSSISYDFIGFPHKTFTADKIYTIKSSVDGSAIYSYSKKERFVYKTDISVKTSEDAISDDDAFSVVVPLLEYFGLPTDKSKYRITFVDNADEVEDDLFGSSWSIIHYMKLNGIPCRKRILNISVCAAEKEVQSFFYRPIIPPENTLDGAIPYASARQLALDWFAKQPSLTVGGLPTIIDDANNSTHKGTQVIAPVYNIFSTSVSRLTEQPKTYYCWEVPFAWVDFTHIHNVVVWVNIQTGEIVGAGEQEGG